jgi:hypothetical protein
MDPLTLIARFLNALVSPIARWAEGRLALSNARAKHDMEREWRIQEHREGLQRATLVEIQDLLFELARDAGALQHLDLTLFRQVGQWGLGRTGNEEGERIHHDIVRLNKLAVLVEDVPLRDAIEQFRDGWRGVTAAKSEDQSDDALTRARAGLQAANQRIGEILLTLGPGSNGRDNKSTGRGCNRAPRGITG